MFQTFLAVSSAVALGTLGFSAARFLAVRRGLIDAQNSIPFTPGYEGMVHTSLSLQSTNPIIYGDIHRLITLEDSGKIQTSELIDSQQHIQDLLTEIHYFQKENTGVAVIPEFQSLTILGPSDGTSITAITLTPSYSDLYILMKTLYSQTKQNFIFHCGIITVASVCAGLIIMVID